MKKGIIKIILTAMTAMLLIAIPLSASAAEADTEGAAPVTEEAELNAEPESVEAKDEAAEKNIFETVYDTLLMHSAEILSALAFIGTLIVSYAYKKGLLPVVKGTLSALTGSVGSIKESAARLGESSESRATELCERLCGLEQGLKRLSEGASSLEGEILKLEGTEREGEILRAIMGAQVDMLYEIFMSSAIPEYQKESVGARINTMRQSLEALRSDEK